MGLMGLMAGKVCFSVSMSLDGCIAPKSREDLMGQQWMELQPWVFPPWFFREHLKRRRGEGAMRKRKPGRLPATAPPHEAAVIGVYLVSSWRGE